MTQRTKAFFNPRVPSNITGLAVGAARLHDCPQPAPGACRTQADATAALGEWSKPGPEGHCQQGGEGCPRPAPVPYHGTPEQGD